VKMKLAIIGSGIKARQYLEIWSERDDLEILAVADLSEQALDQVDSILGGKGLPNPARYTNWESMLEAQANQLDAVYISSPHAFHAQQAVTSLNAGLDVLLEKPMVMSVEEAEDVNEAQDVNGNVLVVAYQGGLSPLVHQLREDVASKTYGELTSISATIWEEWATKYSGGHWKQQPEISGGGFMFDTGAHMMNTVSMVCNADFERIAAFMDQRSCAVDAVSTAIGRLTNGTLFTLHASGETIPVCESRIELFFTEAIVRLCAWGRWIEIERKGKLIERKEQESANNLMDIFQEVRAGTLDNPSTASQGLKMAKLWDAIKASATADGQPILVSN